MTSTPTTTTTTGRRQRPRRIAVVGSGLGGLSVAHLLSMTGVTESAADAPFEIHLFERSSSLGMDSSSVPIPCSCDTCVTGGDSEGAADADVAKAKSSARKQHVSARMDVPMRSFFPEYYPKLKGLYDSISIPYITTETTMTFVNLGEDVPLTVPTAAYQLPESYPTSLQASSRRVDGKVKPQFPPSYFSFSSIMLPHPIGNVISFPDFSPLSTLLSAPSVFFARFRMNVSMIVDYFRLVAYCKYYLHTGEYERAKRGEGSLADVTLGDWMKVHGFADGFGGNEFSVLFSLVCTCSFQSLWLYPAALILEYVGAVMPWGKASFVSCGINKVCEGLAKPIKKVSFDVTVNRIVRTVDGDEDYEVVEGEGGDTVVVGKLALEVTRTGSNKTELIGWFDHVVFATQANQACRIIKNSDPAIFASPAGEPTVNPSDILSRFPYDRALVVCHSDDSLLPPGRESWRLLNFCRLDPALHSKVGPLPRTSFEGSYDPTRSATCTHYVQISSPELPLDPPMFQSTNPVVAPDPEKVFSVTWFERCTATLDSMRAVNDLDKVQGVGNVWYVGSYAAHGIPLLEGCIESAALVAEAIVKREDVDGVTSAYMPWSVHAGAVVGSSSSLGNWFLLGAIVAILMAYLVMV